jgi:hypothetical protein
VNEIYMLLVNSQVLYIKVYKERFAMFGLIGIMEVEMLLTFLPPWLTYTWLPENIAFELKCTEVHGVAKKTWRVFLVPRRKWLVKCTLLYSRVPDKSLFTGYQKHTAICFRPTCRTVTKKTYYCKPWIFLLPTFILWNWPKNYENSESSNLRNFRNWHKSLKFTMYDNPWNMIILTSNFGSIA